MKFTWKILMLMILEIFHQSIYNIITFMIIVKNCWFFNNEKTFHINEKIIISITNLNFFSYILNNMNK